MTKAIGLIAVAVMFAVGLLIGCQSISDKFWPVHIPTSVPKYIGADVNNIGYPSLEKLKDMSLQVKVFHEHTQAWIDYQSKDDNLTYNSINSITSTIIEQAEKEQQAIFGPGGLASIIITALLAGGGTPLCLEIYGTRKLNIKQVLTKLKIVHRHKLFITTLRSGMTRLARARKLIQAGFL